MSRDIVLEPKKGKKISVAWVYGSLLDEYPDTEVESGSDEFTLSVMGRGQHFANATVHGKKDKPLKWGIHSPDLISYVCLNGAHKVSDVADQLLEKLHLKDVTSGDEEEDNISWDDELLSAQLDKAIEENHKHNIEFNKHSSKSTKLGLFRPQNGLWICDSVACAPTCFAKIDAPDIADNDLRVIVKAFETEAAMREAIIGGFNKELKRDWRKKVLGVGLRGLVIHGDLNKDGGQREVPDLIYRISVRDTGEPEDWAGVARVRRGEIIYSSTLPE